jgi:hypothetical protein
LHLAKGVSRFDFFERSKNSNIRTFVQSPCLLHSYKNITRTLQGKLEHYDALSICSLQKLSYGVFGYHVGTRATALIQR